MNLRLVSSGLFLIVVVLSLLIFSVMSILLSISCVKQDEPRGIADPAPSVGPPSVGDGDEATLGIRLEDPVVKCSGSSAILTLRAIARELPDNLQLLVGPIAGDETTGRFGPAGPQATVSPSTVTPLETESEQNTVATHAYAVESVLPAEITAASAEQFQIVLFGRADGSGDMVQSVTIVASTADARC